MKHSALCLLTALVCWMPQSALTQDSMEQLVKQMPPGANAVMVANIANIRGSQIGRSEKWGNSNSATTKSGIGFLPQGTNAVVFASQMDFVSFTPMWTSGYMTFQRAPALVQVSRQVDGTMDAIAGQDILHTSSDLFVFRHNDQVLGTYSPANRQTFASWLTSLSASSGNPLGPYLMKSIVSPDRTSDFIIAFDVANVVSSSKVFQRAKDSDALKRSQIDPKEFSDLIASLRGITISVTFDTGINASVVIEFGSDTKLVAPVAKQLLIEFTDNYGTHMAELANWNVKVDGNQVTTGGSLSKESLRRLVSLFDTPEPHMTAPQPKAPAPTASAAAPAAETAPATAPASQSTGKLTKEYFGTVTSILSELEKGIGQASLSTYLYQKWLKSYADKIDNLSMNGVDPDMLKFGAWVAQSFREISLQITHGHQESSVKDKNMIAYNANEGPARYRGYGYGGGYGYGYGGYGYGGLGSGINSWRYNQQLKQADSNAIHQQSRTKTIDFGAQLFTQIRERESKVRLLMAQRYPGQF